MARMAACVIRYWPAELSGPPPILSFILHFICKVIHPQNIRSITLPLSQRRWTSLLYSARIELREVGILETMGVIMETMGVIMDETSIGDTIGNSSHSPRPPDIPYNEVRPWLRVDHSFDSQRNGNFEGMDEDPCLCLPVELSGQIA